MNWEKAQISKKELISRQVYYYQFIASGIQLFQILTTPFDDFKCIPVVSLAQSVASKIYSEQKELLIKLLDTVPLLLLFYNVRQISVSRNLCLCNVFIGSKVHLLGNK